MRKIWVVILLAPLLLVSMVAAGPTYSPESLARYFRLDWQGLASPSGPALGGALHHQTAVPAERMQLTIEELDAAGNVVGQMTSWLGDVPPARRSFFTARVHQAASY